MRPIDADALIVALKRKAPISDSMRVMWAECLQEVRFAPTIEPESKWIPCSERLPEETVLVTVETKTFKHRYICEAVWIPRWTWKASFDNWEDCSEYNEDEDEFYVNEGWYERVHNWDEYSYVGIEDTVLAWMPLPEPYEERRER